MARHITERGISLIKKLEGFSNIMYLDIAGFATIGYGHLVKPNEKDLFKMESQNHMPQIYLKRYHRSRKCRDTTYHSTPEQQSI